MDFVGFSQALFGTPHTPTTPPRSVGLPLGGPVDMASFYQMQEMVRQLAPYAAQPGSPLSSVFTATAFLLSMARPRASIDENFKRIESGLARVEAHLELHRMEIEEPTRQDYHRRMEKIRWKLLFLKDQTQRLERQTDGLWGYAEDIQIGQKLLLCRVVELSGYALAEPVPPGLEGVGLRFQNDEDEIPVPALRRLHGEIVEALIQHDVGYGRKLTGWEHQVGVRNLFRSRFKNRMDDLEKGVPTVNSGTVVMPQGTGKTRTMVLCFASAIELGAYDPSRGDIFLILNSGDDIHNQNLNTIELLSAYFKKTFGINLKITQYKGGDKNLDGHAVVVSLPTINTEERLQVYVDALRKRLGATGRIVVQATDEIHHREMGRGKTKETVINAMDVAASICPSVFDLGFTATPTGNEGPYIARLKLIDMIRKRVSPRLQIVKTPGVVLDQVKVSRQASDVSPRQMVSALREFPGRNVDIFKQVERYGLRMSQPSPSGRERFQGIIGFALDLEDARHNAEDFIRYCGRPGETGVRGRNLRLIGSDRGKITAQQLKEALASYEKGEIDGIVALVSGDTPDEVRETIKGRINQEGREAGGIEMVQTVDIWIEGADLHMFSNQIRGLSFSRIRTAQEMGRLNRRSPGDVTPQGKLLHDREKILFDPVDSTHGDQEIIHYSDLIGVIGMGSLPVGSLFDVYSGQSIGEPGAAPAVLSSVEGESPTPTPVDPAGKSSERSEWQKMGDILGELLKERYESQRQEMADDLGIPLEDLDRLLQGRGWVDRVAFLQRMATLLFLPRNELLRRRREIKKQAVWVDEEAVQSLQKAFGVFESSRGAVSGSVVIQGNGGWGEDELSLTDFDILHLREGNLNDREFFKIWRGLHLYLRIQLRNHDAAVPEATSAEWNAWNQARRSLRDQVRKSMALFTRTVLPEELPPEEGPIAPRQDRPARKLLVLELFRRMGPRFGSELPVHHGIPDLPDQIPSHSLLSQWMQQSIPLSGPVIAQLRTSLAFFGMPSERMDLRIRDAVYEQEGWRRDESSFVTCLRDAVAPRWGTAVPSLEGVSKSIKLREKINQILKEGVVPSPLPIGFWDYAKAVLIAAGLSEERAEQITDRHLTAWVPGRR
jgi:hypothetical protein